MLIKCPECGKEFSDKAAACPNCGCPTTEIAKNTAQEKKEEPKPVTRVEQAKENPFAGADRYKTGPQSDAEVIKDRKEARKFNAVIIIGVILGILFLIVGSIKSEKDDEDDRTSVPAKVDENLSKRKPQISDQTQGYYYITLDDLDKYYANLVGQNVLFVGEVGETYEGELKISSGTVYYISCEMRNAGDSSDELKGKKVAIFGTVGEMSDFGILGNSINVLDCRLAAIDDVSGFQKSTSDLELAPLLVATGDVADAIGKKNISEEEYRALCVPFDISNYKDLQRHTDSYKGQYVQIEGIVKEVRDEVFGHYTIFIADNGGNYWAIDFKYDADKNRIMSGDKIVAYGIIHSMAKINLTDGSSIEIPYVDASYVDLFAKK